MQPVMLQDKGSSSLLVLIWLHLAVRLVPEPACLLCALGLGERGGRHGGSGLEREFKVVGVGEVFD